MFSVLGAVNAERGKGEEAIGNGPLIYMHASAGIYPFILCSILPLNQIGRESLYSKHNLRGSHILYPKAVNTS